jgi:hypothetical protein
MLVIRCPITREEIPTGITVDIHTFAGLPAGETELHCLACGELHLWSPGDAMLAPVTEAWRLASPFNE